MLHGSIRPSTEVTEFFPGMKATYQHLPTQRPTGLVSCFMQGIDRAAVKDWPLSGRPTE